MYEQTCKNKVKSAENVKGHFKKNIDEKSVEKEKKYRWEKRGEGNFS